MSDSLMLLRAIAAAMGVSGLDDYDIPANRLREHLDDLGGAGEVPDRGWARAWEVQALVDAFGGEG